MASGPDKAMACWYCQTAQVVVSDHAVGEPPDCRRADGEAVVKLPRGSHGDVAGVESGASSVQRSTSEHGNRPGSAPLSTSPTWPAGLGTPSPRSVRDGAEPS